MTEDKLTIATCEGVRIYAITDTNLVQKAATLHNSAHLATAALGRAMTGALLLSATMKDNEKISINLKGDGPLGGVFAEACGSNVKGYTGNPDLYLPLNNGKLDVGGAVGKGTIAVTRYLLNAEPFTGYANLVDGEIASDLTNYLFVSEQTPASVALGVLVNQDGTVAAAGGYFIQAMPGCDEEVLKKLELNVSLSPYVTQMMQLGYDTEKIIQILTRDLKTEIKNSYPVSFKCNCSHEKISGMLNSLSKEDLESLAELTETEVQCQFCSQKYTFSKEEILTILQQKS